MLPGSDFVPCDVCHRVSHRGSLPPVWTQDVPGMGMVVIVLEMGMVVAVKLFKIEIVMKK